MPSIQKLRLACWGVTATSIILLFFAYKYSSMAVEFAGGPSDAARTFGTVSEAFTFAGLLGGVIAGALRMIVQHIDSLETALAKFVTSDADPKMAADALAAFLREAKNGNKKRQMNGFS